MEHDAELESTIGLIQKTAEEAEGLPIAQAKDRLKGLFDAIVSQYDGEPGMQSVMLSMACGDIRHMERADGGELFETWCGWVFEAGLEPRQVSRNDMRSACKRVFGKEDALLY